MAKNKRNCPALGAWILSSRCGEERGIRIVCSPDCEFNPFALGNYDQLLEIEVEVVDKALDCYTLNDATDPEPPDYEAGGSDEAAC